MKKKLLSLVALASLMLVGCNDDKKSELAPSSETPTSESAKPSTGKPSTEKPTTEKPTSEAPTFDLTTPEGRHAYYMNYQSNKTADITIQGKVVQYVTYPGSTECNVAIQEGIYGYWLNNVAKDSVKMGGSYKFAGKGAAKSYPAVNANKSAGKAVDAIETTTLKLGAAENNFEDSRNAYIELNGTAEVTRIEDNVYYFLVGNEEYSFSYNASVTQAADIVTKLANLKVGCTITKLAGNWYKEKQVSICLPSEIEYTNPKATSVAVTAANNATELQAKTTLQLSAVVNPEGASQKVVWSSENEAVAKVDATGLVTGVAEGTVKIFATAKDTEVKGEITLTVTAAPTTPVNSIAITAAGAATGAKVGETLALSTTVLPDTAAQNVTWSSSDEEIATVNDTGVVSFVGDGDVTITATATDGSGVTGTIALSTVVEGLKTAAEIQAMVSAVENVKGESAQAVYRGKIVSKNYDDLMVADSTGAVTTYKNHASINNAGFGVGDTVTITATFGRNFTLAQFMTISSVVRCKRDVGAPTAATVTTAADVLALANAGDTVYTGGKYIEVANAKLFTNGSHTNLSVAGTTISTTFKAAAGFTLPDVEIYGTFRFWTVSTNSKNKVLTVWADYFQANPSVNPTTIAIAGDDSVNLSASTKFTVTATSTAAGEYENVSQKVTWSVANADAAVTEPLATIAADGTLTAGTVAGSVIVTATSVADPTVKATKTVAIAGVAPTYSLVTDVANIAAGDKISIAYDGGTGKQFAMGAQSKTLRSAVDVNIANDSYVAVEGMVQLEVVTGFTAGTFAFKDVATDMYLAYTKGAGVTKNNILEELDTVTVQSSWNVVIEADGMKITNADATDRILQYNPSNPRFACYTGSQKNASIYELATAA